MQQRNFQANNLPSVLEKWEQTANWVSDQDREWWPFGFLKPQQDVRLSTLRVSLLAALYGVPASLFALVGAKAMGEPVTTSHLIAFPIWTCFAFLALYRGTFAFFWNRRADRLALLSARRRAWNDRLR